MKRWPTKLLSEVVTCLDSLRVPVKEDDRQKRFGSVPYYGANGQVGWIDEAIFNEPLLLVAEDGGHFDEPERGVAYTIRGPSWVNNHAHALRPDESNVLLDFLGYHFRHFDFQPYITGTTRAKLTQRDLMRVEVPVPPLAEQERIVKLLDEADELRKLRIQSDRRAAALIPAIFHEMFGDPATNPNGWPIKRLGDLVLPTEQRNPKENPTEQFFYVDIASVDNKTKTIIESKQIIGANAPSRARKVVRTGDVIVSTVRPNLNAVARIPNYLDTQICSTGFSVLRPSEKVISDYIFAFALSPFFIDCLIAKTTGANYPAVNDSEVKDVPVSIPPLPLQREFAARVAEIREMESAQSASRKRLDDLFQSLLHCAFEGEL